MPLRKVILATGEFYHVVNRGVASSLIFTSAWDYQRFLSLLNYYRYSDTSLSFSNFNSLPKEKQVAFWDNLKKDGKLGIEIFAYCLMPNHFHLLLRQTKEKGIQTALANLQNGYSKYFNLKYERKGPLFQSRFMAVRIEEDSLFIHVSRYIHLNPATAYLLEVDKLLTYRWSSFSEYMGKVASGFLSKDLILKMIGGIDRYREFVRDQTSYQRELDKIKHLILEK